MPVAATLFVKDLDRVATFYRDGLGLNCLHRDDAHWRFDCGGLEFTVHRIPAAMAVEIVASDPPQRRTQASLRLTFPVVDTAAVRVAARLRGGDVDDVPPGWASADADTFLGCDPEGNVFLIEPA